MLKHSISIDSGSDECELACISVTGDGNNLQVSIVKSDSSRPHQCKITDSDTPIPGWANPQTSDAKLSTAGTIVLRLDALAARKFRRSSVIHQIVTPKFTPNLVSTTSNKFDRLASISPGHLVRPLLIPKPSLSRLYPFQKSGVSWLLTHPRGILADDMGLGKTVQVVNALRTLFNNGDISCGIVICPKSLQTIWEEHIAEWAPELVYVRVDSAASQRGKAWSTSLKRTHLMLSSYEQFTNMPEVLSRANLDIVVVDEAHRIRNLSAQISQGVRGLSSDRFWAVTGTPVERDKEDLVTLLSTVEPNRFSIKDGRHSISVLRTRSQPYMLRRLKKDVLSELPKLTEHKIPIELLPQQRESYDKTIKVFTKSNHSQRIAEFGRLRTICDHDPLTEESAKADEIIKILHTINSCSEKAVVFSHFLRPLELLKRRIDDVFGKDAAIELTGDQEISTRSEVVKKFKTESSRFVLLASSRIGGEGLTLTEANHAIFINRWWNPSNNDQARDRIYRIGQTRPVHLYTFTSLNTIEELMDKILSTKTLTTKNLVDRLAVLLKPE